MSQAAVLTRRDDDAGIHLERLAQPVPRAVQRGSEEIAVFPVPVVVDVEFGVLQAAVEIVVSRVGRVREQLAETPRPHPLLAQRFLEADEEPPVAVLVLEEADLGVEVLARFAVLEPDPVMPVVLFRVDVVGVVAARQAGGLGARGEA